MSTVPNQGTAALRQTYQRVSRGFWQWCSQRGASLILLLLLALALAVSYAFPQTPAHIRSDPTKYREWLSTIRIQYKNWTAFLEAIGVFNVRHMAWFRVLLALIALVSLIWLGDQIGRLVQPPQIKQPASFYGGPGTATLVSAMTTAEVITSVQRAIARLGLRIHTETDGDATHLYGHRPRWRTVGALLFGLGSLSVAIGLAVNARWGWEQQDVQLLPGQTVLLGPEKSHRAELQNTSVSLEEATIAIDGQRALVRGERSTRRGTLGCQLTDQSGLLVQVSAQHVEGRHLQVADYAVRPEPLDSLQFAFSRVALPDERDRLFIVPEEKLVVRLKWLNHGEMPRFQQWVFRQGGQELVGEKQIEIPNGASETTIGDVTYNWRASRYVMADFTYRPGRLVSSTGAVLLVIGLTGQLAAQKQVWSMIYPQDGQNVVRIRQQREGLLGRRSQGNNEWPALRAEIEGGQ
jgi:hypothetical protein